MIIYYHCTRDSGLLLSFLLTCHPYILVPPVFLKSECPIRSSRAIAQPKIQLRDHGWPATPTYLKTT